MKNSSLSKLADLVSKDKERILESWRAKVRELPSAKNLDTPTLNDEVPRLLEDLTQAFRRAGESPYEDTEIISAEHGLLRWQAGFDVIEIVSEYNILRGCLQDATEREDMVISGDGLRIIDRIFNDAVGKAIKAFETMMLIELRHRHEEHSAFLLHDLRTPLEAMSLATMVLDRCLSNEAKTDRVLQILAVLRGNINRLSDRLRQVLHGEAGLGRSFKADFSFLNLHEHLERLIRDLDPLASSADTEIKNEVPPSIEIYSDEQLVAQLFQNLLSNAIKFTVHGSIEVGAREVGNDGTIECWVKDTGSGISPERIERIFERFETQGDLDKRGIGLGLAIVKEVIDLHKGKIAVASEVGVGTTFTLLIPGKPK